MTTEITTADLAAKMAAADLSVEDELRRVRNNARDAAVADLVGPHLPSHLPVLHLRCHEDFIGEPHLSDSPARPGYSGGIRAEAAVFAAWVADQGIEDYSVRLPDGVGAVVFTAQLRLAGLPLTLRLFVWPWDAEADAAEAIVADAVSAAHASRVEVAA